jgi:hypothetical protein
MNLAGKRMLPSFVTLQISRPPARCGSKNHATGKKRAKQRRTEPSLRPM